MPELAVDWPALLSDAYCINQLLCSVRLHLNNKHLSSCGNISIWKSIVAARCGFSLFYAALKKYSVEVIHVTPQPGGSLSRWQKTGGITVKHVQYGGIRQYYGGAMQLVGLGTVLRADKAP